MSEHIQICPRCQTGKDTYALDSKEPVCPNIGRHKDGECSAFVPLGRTVTNHTVFSPHGLDINKNF